MTRGVVGFDHLLQPLQLRQRRGVILGTLQIDADEATDVIAKLLHIDHRLSARDDTGLFHLLNTHMDGRRADGEPFAQLGIGNPRILLQSRQDGAIQIVDLMVLVHFAHQFLVIIQQ